MIGVCTPIALAPAAFLRHQGRQSVRCQSEDVAATFAVRILFIIVGGDEENIFDVVNQARWVGFVQRRLLTCQARTELELKRAALKFVGKFR